MDNVNEIGLVLKMQYARLTEMDSKIEKFEKTNLAQRGPIEEKGSLAPIVKHKDTLIAEIETLSKKYIGIITIGFKR